MSKKIGLAISLIALFSLSLVNSVYAVPGFARQHGVPCSSCHTAWPQLNETGRQFKELGYRYPEDLEEEKSFSDLFEDGFPISAVLVARPYDKKENGNRKIRALHEAEIFVAGAIGTNWSGFMEIEAEDETDFKPEIGSGTLSYNYRYIFINKCYHSLIMHTGLSPGGGISQRSKEILDRFIQPKLTWFSPHKECKSKVLPV